MLPRAVLFVIRLEGVGDFAGFAVADWSAVDRSDCDDLRGGAGQEAFVGGVQVVAHERLFRHGNVALVAQLHNDVPCDARKDARRRIGRQQFSILYDENIVAAALGHMPDVVIHHGFVSAEQLCLGLGQDAAEVVQ